ncbi:MAG: hypothetical protein U9R23_01690 [Candidatus Cloacimonadota bacterium]|nr:hypothetical protein [Candidatus Cloacimonadota bacterium]
MVKRKRRGWFGKEKGREVGCFKEKGSEECLELLYPDLSGGLVKRKMLRELIYPHITEPQYLFITKPQLGNGNGVAYEKFI